MGNMANIKEFFDCCNCTHRDLKASHHFEDGENDIESVEQNNSSCSETEFLTMQELEEFNKKFDKKLEKYKQIPKTSNILYKSGIIE